MRANFVVNKLINGVAEYYSRDFSIEIDWDGKLDFTIQVIDNVTKGILETSNVTHLLGDSPTEPPIYVVWDKVWDEVDRLKTKYILNYDGHFNRHPGAITSME